MTANSAYSFTEMKRHLTIAGMLCLTCVIIFLLFPNIDLAVSQHFYEGEFYWDNNSVIRFIYLVFAKIHVLYLILFIGFITLYQRRKAIIRRNQFVFLLCALLLGPGILVNALLKDNSVGRPRPVHTVDFGGKETFTPVFHYSGKCQRNCSFVSGHAAIGFYFLCGYWAFGRRRWLLFGILGGIIVGGTRIVQGGHYFSDVIFAGWVVYFTGLGLAIFFNKFFPLPPSNSSG